MEPVLTADSDSNDALEVEVANYRAMLQSMQKLTLSSFVFDADSTEDIDRLINLLWTGNFKEALNSLSKANPEVTSLFRIMTRNTYKPSTEQAKCRNERDDKYELEAIFAMLCRKQSRKNIPLLTVILSLRAYKVKCHSRLEEAITCFFRGALMSISWTEKLIARALELDPGPSYESLPGVGACLFDNLTIKVAYKSYATQNTAGHRLDMTNWAQVAVPRHLVAPNFSIASICAPPQHTSAYKCIQRHRHIKS